MNLKDLKALADAATPGPWAWEHVGEGNWCLGLTEPPSAGQIVEQSDETTDKFSDKPDAAFIAAARTAVPALIERLERVERAARKAISTWTKAIDERRCCDICMVATPATQVSDEGEFSCDECATENGAHMEKLSTIHTDALDALAEALKGEI